MRLIDIIYRPNIVCKSVIIARNGSLKINETAYFGEYKKTALTAHVSIFPATSDDLVFHMDNMPICALFSEIKIEDDVFISNMRQTPHGIQMMFFAFKADK